jgi:hypothetical protein
MTTINVVADKWEDFYAAIAKVDHNQRCYSPNDKGPGLDFGKPFLIVVEGMDLQIQIFPPQHSRNSEHSCLNSSIPTT